jgi:transposase-like protein
MHTYPTWFRAKVVIEAAQGAVTDAQLARRYGVDPGLIGRWRDDIATATARLLRRTAEASWPPVFARPLPPESTS